MIAHCWRCWIPAALILVSCLRPDSSWSAVRDVIPPGSKGQPYAASRSYVRGAAPGVTRPAQVWFICDPQPGARITIVTLPNQDGQLAFPHIYKDSSNIKELPVHFRLGEPDPGAGQVQWPVDDGKGATGDLHAFNPGMLSDPADAFTPPFTSISIGSDQASCRWVARTRLMGLSRRRTFLVTQGLDGGLEYQTFDYKDATSAKSAQPSLDIKGGRETSAGFGFASNGYTYDLAANAAGGMVRVRKAGRTIATEPLIAWTIAPGR